MTYRIEYANTTREPFGENKYHIYKDGRFIALYVHDYRGDDHRIEFVNGIEEDSPVGNRVDFIVGGGPEPLAFSNRAMDYLNEKLGR